MAHPGEKSAPFLLRNRGTGRGVTHLTKVLRIASMTRETPEEAIDYDMIQVAWLELGGTI